MSLNKCILWLVTLDMSCLTDVSWLSCLLTGDSWHVLPDWSLWTDVSSDWWLLTCPAWLKFMDWCTFWLVTPDMSCLTSLWTDVSSDWWLSTCLAWQVYGLMCLLTGDSWHVLPDWSLWTDVPSDWWLPTCPAWQVYGMDWCVFWLVTPDMSCLTEVYGLMCLLTGDSWHVLPDKFMDWCVFWLVTPDMSCLTSLWTDVSSDWWLLTCPAWQVYGLMCLLAGDSWHVLPDKFMDWCVFWLVTPDMSCLTEVYGLMCLLAGDSWHVLPDWSLWTDISGLECVQIGVCQNLCIGVCQNLCISSWMYPLMCPWSDTSLVQVPNWCFLSLMYPFTFVLVTMCQLCCMSKDIESVMEDAVAMVRILYL